RTLEELGMNGVPAEALRRLPHGGPDLARLTEAVAEELARDGLVDRAAMYQVAVAVAAEATAPHPVGLPVLVLDVPVASAVEARLIGAIAARAPTTLATAAEGDACSIDRPWPARRAPAICTGPR